MSLRPLRLALALALLALAHPAHADDSPAPTPPKPKRHYFYWGYDYGTQALYSPMWVFLNRGWDVLQDHVADRNVFALEYRHNMGNVLDNLAHPVRAINDLGWKTFLTTEVFPLNWTEHGARWTPNYSLHLLGGGMTYAAMAEWYEAHDVPLPHVFSFVTVMATALVNEAIENKGVRGRNTDAIADIYIFDLGGILLFSSDWVKSVFSDYLVLADWSLQPSFTSPRGELHNMGNYFALKVPIPFLPSWRVFSYFGEATTFGLSYQINPEYSVSLSGGGAATRLVNQLTDKVQNVVTFVPTVIAFVDRRQSLLASLQVSALEDYFIHLNVYPHAFWRRGPSVGAWGVADQRGHLALGVCFGVLGFGVGTSGLVRGY